MDHAPRMRRELNDLEGLLSAEKSKPASSQNKDFIRDLETQIRGLKMHLAGK
jgi:hypothetical protein